METERLLMRAPVHADVEAIFARYASDADVTTYLAWPRQGPSKRPGRSSSSATPKAQMADGPLLVFSRPMGRCSAAPA